MRKKIIGSFLFSLFLVACTLVNLKATAVPEPTVIPPRTVTDHPTSDKARAVDINAHAIEWLQNSWLPQARNGQPLFLFLYYFDPHVWYDPLPPYDTLYDSDYSGWLTPAVYRDSQDAVAGKITLSERDLQHLIALYDGEITYWDTYFGQMIAFLDENHLLDNALMLVTADHGESLGEHGKWTHGSSLYEEVLRVPLLMRYSGVIPAGVVVESPAQNFDLTPTILDWAGVALPQDLQALSLRSAALGETSAPQRQLFSEVDALLDKKNALYWAAPRISLRMVEQGDWKLLHYLEQPQLDELYLLQPSSLYEQENLILSEPHRAEQLLQDLNNWFDLAP
jgi:arylsulfatase A-like enzyme